MRARLVEQLEDVVVVDGVIRLAAFAADADESQRPEQTQLVRNGGFTDAHGPGEIADAQLSGREDVKNPHARRIAEHPERFRHGFDVSGPHNLCTYEQAFIYYKGETGKCQPRRLDTFFSESVVSLFGLLIGLISTP